ncbi:hypothetical protein HNR46_001671 [Haloferula luteola]|uniref:Uncharacterized protein n=1 Tax=Haloferula luteola TaxID=595692 RepID=A0A840V0B5_9BACT|nr:Ig-like domain-containing protein [Haloferula luteola]MBB5351435.1 hypothetical protein [Haloferula luteola]
MTRTFAAASSAALYLTCSVQGMEFGNVDVVQLNATNNGLDSASPAVSVSVAPGSTANFSIRAANRGDTDVSFGMEDDTAGGVMLTSVRENGRDNSATGDTTGLSYATSHGDLGSGYFFIPVAHSPLGSEFNINIAAAFFPFTEGWICGYTQNSSGTNGGVQDELHVSAGIASGAQFFDNGSGNFKLDLTTLSSYGVNATGENGVLLVTGFKNEDNFALSADNADGTFNVVLKDNQSNGTGTERDPISFVYIPTAAAGPDLVTAVGRVQSDGSSEVSGGNYTVTKLLGPVAGVDAVNAFGTTADMTARETLERTANTVDTSTDLAVSDASGIVVGMEVSGTGITEGTTVVAISGTTITISEPAFVTDAGVSISFISVANDTTLTVVDASGIEVGQKVSGTGIADGTTVVAVDGTQIEVSKGVSESGSGVAVEFATQGRWLLQIAAQTGETGTLIVSPCTGEANNLDNIVSYEWDAALEGWVVESRDIVNATDNPVLEDGAVADEDMFSFAFFTIQPENEQPTIAITSPSNGQVFSQGSSVTITADAADAAPGSVTAVEFYLNGALVATDTTAPYEYTTPVYSSPVNFTVDAIVEDNAGARTTAEQVYFSVVPPAGSGGLFFNGVDDYVTFGDDPSLKLSTFTLETWFYRVGSGVATGTGSGGVTAIPLVTKGRGESDQSNVDMNYFLGIDEETGVLAADFEDINLGTNAPVFGKTPVEMNTWQHAVATYDGTEWRLYLNGNLEAVVNTGGLLPRADSIQHAGIGTALNSLGEPAGYFHGFLDESRIWNRALTQSEVRERVNFEIPAESGLVGRWGMTEGAGETITSTAAGNVAGSLMNGPIWTAGHAFSSNAKPEVAVTSPLEGDRYLLGETIALTASASDADGTITKVDFFDNGVLVGSDNAEPFEFSYTNAPLGGLHRLTAVATDNLGETSLSGEVVVDVTLPSPTLPGYTAGVIDGGDVDADTEGTSPADPANWVVESSTATPLAFDNPGTVLGSPAININGAPVPFASGLLIGSNYTVLGNLAAADNNLSPFEKEGYYGFSVEDNGGPGEDNPATPDESSRFSLSYLPFADGWIGGNFDATGAVIGGSANLPAGVSIVNTSSGAYEITGLPASGNLISMGYGDGLDNVTSVGLADDKWTVISRDNGQGVQNSAFSFVYVPVTTEQVFSGLVTNDGELVALNDQLGDVGGSVNLGTQGYEVTIGDGTIINPSNSVMLIAADYNHGNAGDNIMSYSAVGNVFVVFSQDLPGLNAQFQQGGFRFVVMPMDSVTLNGDEVVVYATDNQATENSDDDIVLTFRRSGDTDAPLTVNYSVGGTATPGDDYDVLSGAVTFPAGESIVELVIAANGDVELEQAESLIVTLQAGTGYTVGVFNKAMASILNAAPQVPTTTVSFQEGTEAYTGQLDMLVSERGTEFDKLGVDYDNYFLDGRPANSSPDDNALIHFDNIFGDGPGQIPVGSEVIDAHLYLTTSTVGNAQTGGPYLVDRLVIPVDYVTAIGENTTTWANLGFDDSPDNFEGFEGARGASTLLPVSGFGTVVQGGVNSADVTPIVQAWSKGEPNYGFSIFSGGTTDGWSICTVGNPNPVLRPRLVVTYTPLSVKEYYYETDQSAVLNTRALPDGATVDGSAVETLFLDLNDANTGTTEALMRFPVTFGTGDDGSIPIGEEVVKAELLIVTNSPIYLGSGNAQTGGDYTVHQMLNDWNTESYFGNLGPVVGTDISPEAARFNGMGWSSMSYVDITTVVRNWRAGAENYGVNVKPDTEDGWQPFFPGIKNNPQLAGAAPMLRVQTAIITPSLFDQWATLNGISGSNFNEDADGDGIVELMEYALGLNPRQYDLLPSLQADGTIRFGKGADAAADPAVQYGLETSTDLVEWETWTPTTDNESEISGQLPMGEARVFGRLTVSYVPVTE